MPPQLIAIVGPNASGKSALAMRVAALLPVEIIACDSLQVYVGMDLGTGKPTPEERRAVPHHLLDAALPTEAFHAARFAALARQAVKYISARGRVPVVVGGAGLYLRALLVGLFEAPPPDPEIRERHLREAAAHGTEWLHARLAVVDAETARQVKPRDLVRISRALEVYEQTGLPIGELRRRPVEPSGIKSATLVVDPPLSLLREKIAARFDAMMAAGLLEETRQLRARYGRGARPLQALGYKQMGDHLDGLLALPDAIAAAKTATVDYARRQRTWFRKERSAWRVEAAPDPAEVVGWWRRQQAPAEPE